MKADAAPAGGFPALLVRDPAVTAALLIALVATATILGAWYFQIFRGLAPCPLCLEERIPYYVAIPLGIAVALGARAGLPRWLVILGLVALLVTMLVGAGLGVYHAGVEWKWWAGPQDCTGPLNDLGGRGGLLKQLQSISIVRCDQVDWRFLGLSLAGYNALISLGLAAVAAWGLLAPRRT